MKISIKYTGSILNLPASIVDIAPVAGEAELKTIIGIFAFSNHFNDFESVLPILSEKLGLDISEITASLEFWAKNGIIELDGYEPTHELASIITDRDNTMPAYTGAQITKLMKENSEIEMLFVCAQEVLGKSFNTHDYNSVLYLKSYFKFSDDFILMLLAHCLEIDKASWAYIRRTAKNLYDDGIDTYEKLEKHFAARRNKRSLEYKIRKLFGIGEREFTKRERDVFEHIMNGKFDFELIEKAYELTIDNIGKSSLSYTAKVLDNWQEAGIKTVEDAEKSLSEYRSKQNMSSFDTDDFFEAALKRSNERIKERSKK